MEAKSKTTKLFDIVASCNSLTGKFTKGERLTVNVVKHPSIGYRGEFYFQVEVNNARGERVNRILKMASQKRTAVGWAEGNFGHERIAA